MNRFWLICIFLCGIYTASSQSQLADSLFLAGKYKSAAVFYEQAIYKNEGGLVNDWLFKKSDAYMAVSNFDQALSTLKRIKASNDPSINKRVIGQLVLGNFQNENYQQAFNEVLRYELLFGQLTRELIILKSLTLAHLNRWEESRSFLTRHKEELMLTQAQIHSFYPKKLKVKDPEKAYTISLFLPGVGQMYSGYFFRGVLSGTIQAGLIGFSAYSMWNGYYFSGGLTGVALFYTFYFGGARYAKQLAIKRNEKIAEEISQEILANTIK